MVTSSCSTPFDCVAETVQAAVVWLTDGPKRIFNDIDATGDLLRLTKNVQKVASVFAKVFPLDLIASGLSSVVSFLDARHIFCSVHDLVSGDAARENPLGPHTPNILNVAKTVCTLVQDVTSSLGWLVSIKLLGEWVTKSTAKFALWGKPIVILDGVCDVASSAGSLFSIADSLRLIAKESMEGVYWRNGRCSPSRLIDRCLDVAMDVCSIASSVLNNIPGISIVYMCVSSAVGSMISLGKFFKKQYLDEALIAATVPQGIASGSNNAV